MEHTLNRQTTTILTYINQGRRPAAFPVFPARPPRRRARMAPFSAACPGAAGRPAGAPPAPMGIRRLAPGPVVMALPIPRMRKDRAPDHRIRIPPVRRSGRGPADANEHGEGRDEGREGTDGRSNGCERGIRVDEDEWGGEGGTPVSRTVAPARACVRGGKRGTPREPVGARPGGTVSCGAATCYSPTPSQVQYHRRARP